MKHYFSLLIVIFLIGYSPYISAENEDSETDHYDLQDHLIENLDDTQVDHYWQTITRDYGEYLPELQKTSCLNLIRQQEKFSVKSIISSMMKYLFHELISNGQLLGLLLLLTIFSVTLQTLQRAFSNSSLSQIAYFVIYIGLIYIALHSFTIAYSYTKSTIDTLSGFMIALIPLLLSLMATIGSMTAL